MKDTEKIKNEMIELEDLIWNFLNKNPSRKELGDIGDCAEMVKVCYALTNLMGGQAYERGK